MKHRFDVCVRMESLPFFTFDSKGKGKGKGFGEMGRKERAKGYVPA